MILTSVHNPRVKAVRALHTKKGRTAEHAFLLETTRLLQEALASGWPVAEVFATEAWLARYGAPTGVPLTPVADHVIEQMVTTETPEGMVAIASLPDEPGLPEVTPQLLLVITESLQDPGNLGTIVRTADAVGATGVVVGPGSVDPYSPKVVRGTMGSLFHLPVIARSDMREDLAALRRQGVKIVATALGASQTLYDLDLTGPVAWLIGNEGAGLSEDAIQLATDVVSIPMPGRAESLNAGIAASVCLYETLRQRRQA